MSASKKKKLRKEQSAGQMTEKQLQQQKESKKLKAYTISFIAIMALVICVAVGVLGARAIHQSGIIQKRTQAAQVGEHKLNSVEFSYFFQDAIQDEYNSWYEIYGTSTDYYLSIMGLNLDKPLDKQMYYGDQTWADYFITSAANAAQKTYAVYDAAVKAGHTLSDEEQANIETTIYNLSFWAKLYGYKNVDKYLCGMYSYGASEESYREYLTVCEMASSYYNTYVDSLEYDDAAIREYEKDKYINYTSFSYVRAYFNYNYFLTGGTKGEDGVTVYTEEEKEAARAAAKAAAETLLNCKTVEEFEMAVNKLEINKDLEDKDKKVTVSDNKNKLYTAVDSAMRDWISSADRKNGDTTVIENEVVSVGEDGGEDTKEIYGYYAVLFLESNENKVKMSNVRHLLVAFEGGTKDDEGNTVYSDVEKKAALDKANELLKKWQEGEKVDEDSFAELVKENTDDEASAATGGLYENVFYGSNYVENFLNWCLDEARKAGDVEIIETEYGYHIMYYSGDAELNYRDYLISNDMRTEDTKEWYDALIKATPLTVLDTSKVDVG